jgi:hypothetical protein
MAGYASSAYGRNDQGDRKNMNKKWRQVSTRFIEFGLANQPNTESGLTQRQRGIIHPSLILSLHRRRKAMLRETKQQEAVPFPE